MKKVAMFGGSFDPPHIGHLQLMKVCIDRLSLDSLILVPAFVPPHKDSGAMADPVHRFNMCVFMERYDSRIKVSDIELKRGGTSYTVDTLVQLKNIYPCSELYLIVGADMYMSLQNWYKPDKICELARVCTVPRNNENIERLQRQAKFLEQFGCESIILDSDIADISSTEVRNAIRDGMPIKEYVLPETYEYIINNKLYI